MLARGNLPAAVDEVLLPLNFFEDGRDKVRQVPVALTDYSEKGLKALLAGSQAESFFQPIIA